MLDLIGPYQVSRELGRGGMGVVYLATDTRLDRQVAIKALPVELASDPARLERFEREAKTLAQLNHPNLAASHGVEEQDGARYLVLEFVEGETLAEMLDRGPLPVEEAIELAVQIAAGVEAAHEAGVIHRDLKPANIIVTPDGQAKVLDFGLARTDEGGQSSSGGHDSPTITSPAIQHSPTVPGVILGTAAYMSPEQARGRRVDKRTDIWSFGVVLYEMLIGASPFAGETASDSIGAVLHKTLDLERLPPTTPANVRRVLGRCLERDKAKRYRDVGDAALDLRAIDEPAGVAPPPPASRTKRAALLATAFLLGAAVIAGAVWLRPSPPAPEPPAPKRFGIGGFDMSIDAFASVAISPTGDSIVVRSREPGGEVMLRVRPMDSLESSVIPGSESAWLPFYSPDGRRIAFYAGGYIWVASVSGGAARRVATTNVGFTGGAWMDDGSIIFTSGFTRSLHWVPSTGGEVEALDVAMPEGAEGITVLTVPSPIPGTDALLVGVSAAGRDDIGVYSRADGRVRILAESGYQPVYAASGHVIYQRTDNGPLMALPFDAERLVATGPPFELRASGGARPSFQSQVYAIAEDGTFASIAPDVIRDATELVRFDAAGEAEVLHTVEGIIDLPRLSRDGRRVAYREPGPNCNIWVLDLVRGATTRITREGDSHGIVWSAADEHIITFQRDLGDARTVMLRADGVGGARELHDATQQNLQSVAVTADDAQVLLTGSFQTDGLPTRGLGVLDVREQVVRIVSDEGRGAALSPDGRLLAYASMQSGRAEVYLQPWPELDERVQVSTGGGAQAAWSRDGKTLYYRSGEHVYAADVQYDDELIVGRPATAIEARFNDGPFGLAGYEPDGAGGFIAVRSRGGEPGNNQIEIVLNFFNEIERLDPSRRQ